MLKTKNCITGKEYNCYLLMRDSHRMVISTHYDKFKSIFLTLTNDLPIIYRQTIEHETILSKSYTTRIAKIIIIKI